jgi:probable DNA metabolism protein
VINAAAAFSTGSAEARQAAENAARDRGDSDVCTVLDAAYKVTREFDRLRGLLRFKDDEAGRYIARCAPDHFVLPLLAEHFTRRFGEIPWAIIDEKRRLVLFRNTGADSRIAALKTFTSESSTLHSSLSNLDPADNWEKLWKTYHVSVNNEARTNPHLQRQFMPERYRKYLTEFS